MKEKDIIPYALNAFQVSEFAERVNAVTGINYNKRPFISGYIYGLRFYANHHTRVEIEHHADGTAKVAFKVEGIY